ncbi:dermonecrotic toxin domain-containing protein [Pseudomonas khavaziana]|uniref:dermonecrotic toxin domain-containing protein n=1 Tax=Pseudomonas khavaziana TaxID=2842351 RepID=UPI001C3CE36B|nr:DUF6543 domain-containing protein [Pseudomonas khavaziana]MBV4482100.1 hypothetical protein [Pseudomonas khavaziana]
MILPPNPPPLPVWDFKPITGEKPETMPTYALVDAPRRQLADSRLTPKNQRADYKQLLHATHNALPRVRDEAKKWAEDMVFKLTGSKIDADTIFLNRFQQAQSANTATGWEHMEEEPTVSQALPDALLGNFNEHDSLPGVLDQQAGLYRAGRGQSTKGGYGAHNQFALMPSQLMHESWKSDFQMHMTQKLESFWRDHGDDYRTSLKGEFVYQARQQLKAYERASPAERARMPAEQRFTRDDYRLVMGAASNLPLAEDQALTVEQLRAQAPVKGVVLTHLFDINGLPANDILRFTAVDDGPARQLRDRRDGVQLLYVPGHQPAFLRFDSLTAMDQWVVAQGRDADKRKALESHFPLRDRQDNDVGFWSDVKAFITGDHQSNKGVDTALRDLGNGHWDSIEGTVIDSANVRIQGDVFSVIKDATQLRMSRDADTMIKSNSEVTRDTWLNDLTVAAGLAAKFAVIGEPIVIGIAAATGFVETEVGVEKSITGDTQAERKHGSTAALDGALNELFAVGGGTERGSTIERPTTIPIRQEMFADGQQAQVIDHPLSASAYTLPRANGYDLVDRNQVYRYLDNRPDELTNLESAAHTAPLEGFEAFCPAPVPSGRVRRGANEECFAKVIANVPEAERPLQALEHVRLFPSKAGLFKRERTVVFEKRLHKLIDGETGAQLVPVNNGERITYRSQVQGQIIADPGFGFYAGADERGFAEDTRVVKLNSISKASDDQRQVRGVVVHSGSQQYLVVEADTAEFYYAPLDSAQTGDISFRKCGPLEMGLAQGYRQFLSAHHAVPAVEADFIALPTLKKAYKQLRQFGFRETEINELKQQCKGMSPEQKREVVYQLQQANAILKPDVALRPRRVTPLQTPPDFVRWPARQQNQFYAQQAKDAVNQALKATGLGPGNLVRSTTDIARADAATITLGWLRRTISLKAPHAGDMIMKTGAGNCGEMAILAHDILTKSGARAAEWHVGDAHAFAVVGGPTGDVKPTVDFSEPSWANAWVVDPWADIACPAPEYMAQLKATMAKWDKAGWKIREGIKRDMSPLDPDWLDRLVNQPKQPYASQIEPVKPTSVRLPLQPANIVQVAMGESTTLNTGDKALATRSLTDCSAIAVLSDWDGARYRSRTLMHLTGSNLELGLRGDAQALLDKLQASLNNGGRVILVGGISSDSLQGMATTIGQSFQGGQPLRDLLQARPGVSVTLASSLGITVKADGTFELLEGTGKGIFTVDQVREIFNRID